MDHSWPSRPGVTPGLKDHPHSSAWCNSRLPGSPLQPSGEFVLSGTTLGIPWNCAAILLEYRWMPLGITPGLEDHLVKVLLGISGTPLTLRPDRRRPSLVIPGPQDSIFLAPSVGTIFVPSGIQSVCVCRTFKRQYYAVCSCAFFQRTVQFFPSVLVGNHICTSRYLKCVCARHTKRQCYPKCSCAFQRTVYARWQCVVFFREQFYAVGIVLSFLENSYIPSALKRNKFQTLGIRTSTV